MDRLAPGERVVLSLSGVGPLSAEIRWNTGFWVGGMFDFELSARELRLADTAPPAKEYGLAQPPDADAWMAPDLHHEGA